MKSLFLLRHANSTWNDPRLNDFERPLNARGREAALRVGRELARLGIGFERIVASPARRVVETLDQLAEGYGRRFAATFEPRLYMASASELLELAASSPPQVETLLLVAHNPGVHELCLRLTGDARLRDKYPSGAFAEIRLHADDWREIDKGGELGRFIRPRELD